MPQRKLRDHTATTGPEGADLGGQGHVCPWLEQAGLMLLSKTKGSVPPLGWGGVGPTLEVTEGQIIPVVLEDRVSNNGVKVVL